VSEAEVDRLPDADAFRDAVFLAIRGTWSAPDLDATDALVLAIVQRIKPAKRG
jgi:hypothetical protein